MREVNGMKESPGVKWAKQPLLQAGLVPGLGGAGSWVNPQAGVLQRLQNGAGCCRAHRWCRICGSLQGCSSTAAHQLHPSALRRGFSNEDGQPINSKAAIHKELLSELSLIL